MNETDLKKMGFSFRTRHLRFYHPIDNKTLVATGYMPAQPIRPRGRKRTLFPFPRGGVTEVDVIWPDGKITTGRAFCSPKDNYNRREGAKMALDRAIVVVFGLLANEHRGRSNEQHDPARS